MALAGRTPSATTPSRTKAYLPIGKRCPAGRVGGQRAADQALIKGQQEEREKRAERASPAVSSVLYPLSSLPRQSSTARASATFLTSISSAGVNGSGTSLSMSIWPRINEPRRISTTSSDRV